MQTAVTIFSAIGQLGGLGVFIWYLISGLKVEVANLKKTIDTQKETLEAQKQTLDAMEARVQETAKIGSLYRKLIDDLPEDIDKYKAVIRTLKDQVILELEEANERKDEKLKELTTSRLHEIQLQEQVLEELPKLRESLVDTVSTLESRLSVLDLFQPGTPIGELLRQFEDHVERQSQSSQQLIAGPPVSVKESQLAKR